MLKAIAASNSEASICWPWPVFADADIGAEDGVEREERAADVGNRHAGLGRRLAGMAGDAHHPGHRLRDQIEARALRPRPGLAEARDAGIDQARIDRGQRRVIDAEPLGDAGAVILDQDVGGLDQAVEHLACRLALQIEREAALVAVQVEEAEAVIALELEAHGAAGLVAAVGRLDLDHVGAHVAQQHGAERPGHHLADVEHPHAGERQVDPDRGAVLSDQSGFEPV